MLPEEEEAGLGFGGGSDDTTGSSTAEVPPSDSELVLKSGKMRGASAVLVMGKSSGKLT